MNEATATLVFRRRSLLRLAHRVWWWLRQVSGDAAYENYLRRVATARPTGGSCPHGAGGVLTREEFFLDALRRRYSGVSRCC